MDFVLKVKLNDTLSSHIEQIYTNNTTTITNFTDVINKGIKQTLLTMDFSKKKEFSGDPVEFMTMIQKTKKNTKYKTIFIEFGFILC